QIALTRPGDIAGTPHYLAPEILRGGSADARSDLWSLGVVLYELASGARPFRGTAAQLGAAILNDPPEPLPARVPPPLAAIIERGLAKVPAQRFRQAGEVRVALEGLASHSAFGSSRMAAQAQGRGAGHRRGWIVAVAGALVVVALLALGVTRWLSRGRSPGV